MKKFSKIGKRVLAFFLVALMNINTYAAVGGNDGSAFVTKAEFDALVNTFNEQMDGYEKSLVTKVDGAIANYLAGQSTAMDVPQISLLNSADVYFIKDWGKPFESRVGNRLNFYMYLGFFKYSSDGYYFELKTSNNNGNSGTWKTAGSDTGIFLRYYKSSFNGEEALVPKDKIESIMQSGVNAVGVNASTGTYNVAPSADARIYEKGITNWGSEEALFVVKCNGQSFNAIGVASWDVQDTITNLKNIETDIFNVMAGTKIDDSSNVYSIYEEDYHTIGDSAGTANCSWGAGQSWSYNSTSSWKSSISATNYKIHLYRHKYSTKKWTDFCNENVSYIANEPVKFYEGVPMFKASHEGVATVEIKFNNSVSTATNTIMLDNKKIANVAAQGSYGSISLISVDDKFEGIEAKDFVKVANTAIKLVFNTKKDETYWIRVMPSNGNVKAKIESAIIVVE